MGWGRGPTKPPLLPFHTVNTSRTMRVGRERSFFSQKNWERKHLLRLGTTKAISCAWMAGKKEFSAVVVKAFKSFSRYFRCLTTSGQSCGILELEGHQ